MEHINNSLHLLAKRLNLIDESQEPEPYILSKEEEDRIIEHEVRSEKEYAKWKMEQLSMTKEQIDFKMCEINWEERVDRNEILQRANSVKNHDLWAKENRKKEKIEEERKAKELQEHWNAKNMYNLMAWASQNVFGKKLIVNKDNKMLISSLCFFLSNDKRFETEIDQKQNMSLEKGLLIRGVSGIGKTFLVRCLEQNFLKPILTLSMIDITHELKSHGEYLIKKGSNKIIYLDDVGTEETPIVHFGTKINYFKDFMETVYHRKIDFNTFIVSTNLSFQNISDKYGFRVASRMREMFNIIDVSGKDMRNESGRNIK